MDNGIRMLHLLGDTIRSFIQIKFRKKRKIQYFFFSFLSLPLIQVTVVRQTLYACVSYVSLPKLSK